LYNFWKEVRVPVEMEVRRVQTQYPSFRTVAVGHSLGGAIASYAAAELRASGIATDLVTFGAPRVGNEAYVQTLMAQAPKYGRNYRFVHKGDPIPSIPWASMGYRHPGPEYVISSDTQQGVTPADIEVRATDDEDGDSTPGLFENGFQDSWKAHTWYFNAVTVCYDGGSLSNLFTPFKNDPATDESASARSEAPTVVEISGEDNEERRRLSAAKKWVKNLELKDGEGENESEEDEDDEDDEW
jgi:alpha-beta hydrolase superfamily lysophospholipase